MEESSLIALGGFALALFALIGGVLYRQGKLEGKLDLLIEDNKEWREEYRREIREAREEFRREMQEMQEENRRNHQQLLQALAHHSHDPATGFATFHFPPGTESPD